jgi:hypothetical protein
LVLQPQDGRIEGHRIEKQLRRSMLEAADHSALLIVPEAVLLELLLESAISAAGGHLDHDVDILGRSKLLRRGDRLSTGDAPALPTKVGRHQVARAVVKELVRLSDPHLTRVAVPQTGMLEAPKAAMDRRAAEAELLCDALDRPLRSSSADLEQ